MQLGRTLVYSDILQRKLRKNGSARAGLFTAHLYRTYLKIKKAKHQYSFSHAGLDPASSKQSTTILPSPCKGEGDTGFRRNDGGF